MSCSLDVVDCFGCRVLLDHANWEKHLADGRHLEVVQYHDRFIEVLQDPDIVVEANRDRHQHYFRSGITRGRHTRLYLLLIVAEFAAVHKIATWRIVPAADTDGRVLWMRSTR